MARSGRLKRPKLAGAAHWQLNNALHSLHAYALYPSLSSLERALRANGVPYASRTTIHNAFSGTRLPTPAVAGGLTVVMAQQAPYAVEGAVDKACLIVNELWKWADKEDREGVGHEQTDTEAEAEAARSGDSTAVAVTRVGLPPAVHRALPSAEDSELFSTERVLAEPERFTTWLASKDFLLVYAEVALRSLFR